MHSIPRFTLFLTLLLCLVSLPLSAQSELTRDAETMEWDDLMPEDFTLSLSDLFGDMDIDILDDYSPEAAGLIDNMLRVLASAPVREELDGRMIRIPGFVVPLEMQGDRVTRFFLVPYFGACIHVPPPPSNQIINVAFEPGTRVESLYDAVWVTGMLRTETFSHDLGTSGYTLDAYVLEPYDFDDDDANW